MSEGVIRGVEVVVAALQASAAAQRAFSELLSSSERQRAARFKLERDRRRFIVARATLRRLLAQRLAARPEAIEITYGAHGKPALAQGLRFNVSHCDDLAVYAFSESREVGIDVEAVRELDDADDLAEHFFSRGENEAYRGLAAHERPLGFFNCWTRKEAFVKALGEGLSHPLDGFDVSLAPREAAKILRVAQRPGDECGWRLESFRPAPGFVAAVVAAAP